MKRANAIADASPPRPSQRNASPPLFTAQTTTADNGSVTTGHSFGDGAATGSLSQDVAAHDFFRLCKLCQLVFERS